MSIREALIDYSKGDNLRLYWQLFRWRERTRRKFSQDVLTFFLNRMAHHHGGYIGNGAVFRGNPVLPHGLHGVFISRYARIGSDCWIYQNVTIGEVERKAPQIGDHCLIGAGAVIVGNIKIGDHVKIGAGAVVCSDVPDYATVVAQPPRLILRGEEMPEFWKGRAWIELDREALRHNISFLRSRLPDGCELMPAVKANAYGHGAVLVAQECERLGIRAFCVATAQEGVELRRAGISGEILVLGYTHPQEFLLLLRYGLTQTVLDLPYAETLNSWGQTVRVHIKIDTGMHRLGERCEHLETLQKIFDCRNLHVTGTFTHLCTADGVSAEDQEFLMAQCRSFYKTVNQLERLGYNCGKLHLMSSYALLRHPEIGGNYARAGVALYGVLSAKGDADRFGAEQLRPVLSLKARVTLVRDLVPGEGAGYGLQFRADRNTKLAVLSIGYADGLPRKLGGGIGAALLHGRRAPIVGRICMDQTLVDVTDIPAVSPGDIAVLIGRSGTQELTACDLAEQTGTISNEILSRLGGRLKRMLQ